MSHGTVYPNPEVRKLPWIPGIVGLCSSTWSGHLSLYPCYWHPLVFLHPWLVQSCGTLVIAVLRHTCALPLDQSRKLVPGIQSLEDKVLILLYPGDTSSFSICCGWTGSHYWVLSRWVIIINSFINLTIMLNCRKALNSPKHCVERYSPQLERGLYKRIECRLHYTFIPVRCVLFFIVLFETMIFLSD